MKKRIYILFFIVASLACVGCATSYGAHQASTYPYNSHARRVSMIRERPHNHGYKKPIKEKPPKYYIPKSQAGKKKRR